jgi:hypothetical protein
VEKKLVRTLSGLLLRGKKFGADPIWIATAWDLTGAEEVGLLQARWVAALRAHQLGSKKYMTNR